MKNVVELTGAQSDLEHLSTVFSSKTLCVTKVERLGKFVLWSSKFNSLQDPSKIYECGTTLIGVINGCAKLRDRRFLTVETAGGPRPVEVSRGVYQIHEHSIDVTVLGVTATLIAEVPSTPDYKSSTTVPNTDPIQLS